MTFTRLSTFCAVAVFAATLFMPTASQAHGWHHHWRHHHRHHQYHDIAPSATSIFGTFPNVKFFNVDGCTYAKDKDTGYTYPF